MSPTLVSSATKRCQARVKKYHNFDKYESIFKILSLADLEGNLQSKSNKDFHLTCSVTTLSWEIWKWTKCYQFLTHIVI